VRARRLVAGHAALSRRMRNVRGSLALARA